MGLHNFTKQVLSVFSDRETALQHETELLQKCYKKTGGENCYNINFKGKRRYWK